VLVDPFTGSVEVLLSPVRKTGRTNRSNPVDVDLRSPVHLNRLPSCGSGGESDGSTGATSPSMRLVPRPPDSPDALKGYLETIGATISDDVKALESVLMLGAQIPRGKQRSSSDSADTSTAYHVQHRVNELPGYTPSPPSLHTHRPPRFSQEAAGDAESQTQKGEETAKPLLPSPRHLVDGVPHLLQNTDSSWTGPALGTAQTEDNQPEAVRCFALPASYAQEGDDESDIISMDQNHSSRSDSSDDAAVGVERLLWASGDEEVVGDWGSRAAANSLQPEEGSLDLATATRLNQELQSQLAVQSTLLRTRRLAAQATGYSGIDTTDIQMSESHCEWDWQSVDVMQRHTDDLAAPASNGLEDAVGDLRTALAVANAARRAAEATIEHMTSTGTSTGTKHSGYTFGTGIAPRTTPALDRWNTRTGDCVHHQHSRSQLTGLKSNDNRDLSSAQLYEAVRQRWAARQETRR
jgi:hypothetical protein